MSAVATAAQPPRIARITGALLLLMAVCAMFAELGVRSALVVPGDAAATASKILASPTLFRSGFVAYLAAFLLDVPVAVLFYAMLRDVGRTRALAALAFRLVYAAVVGAALLPWLGVMILLGDPSTFAALGAPQREALALFCLRLFGDGFRVALLFFGGHLALLGPLLTASKRVPRALGVLVTLGGAAYVVDGLTFVLAPRLQAQIAPALAMLGMSELWLAIWLVVKGDGAERATSRPEG